MQRIVFDSPYRFIPPTTGSSWPWFLKKFLRRYIEYEYGVVEVRFHGVELLRASISAGHAIMLAPNHARPADPMVLGMITHEIPRHLYVMASWHLFRHTRFHRFMIRRLGGFSIYREGGDKASIQFGVDALAEADRLLVVFPEGVVTRNNDRLHPLLEGTAFVARMAAKRREKADPSAGVVIHPVAIRYHFLGDAQEALQPTLCKLEDRFNMHECRPTRLVDRVRRLEEASIVLREVGCFGRAQPGTRQERIERLVEHVLRPLEEQWLQGEREAHTTARVKRLRATILPEMVANQVTPAERARRWEQLKSIYYSQQLAFYPSDPLPDAATEDQLIETALRLEEDITDTAATLRPWQAIIRIGPAIPVVAGRRSKSEPDSLAAQLRESLETMLRTTEMKNSSELATGSLTRTAP